MWAEQAFVKNVHRRSFLRSPYYPLLFFACRSLGCAPLSERLEHATFWGAEGLEPFLIWYFLGHTRGNHVKLAISRI